MKTHLDFYDIDSLLSEEEKMVRNMVRGFAEKEINKAELIEAFHGEKPLDMEKLAPKMGELGMIGAIIPEEYGGAGANYVTYGLITQEMERVDGALGGFIRVQTGLIMYPIWKFGSEEQKKKWLPLVAAGKKIGCFGLTEPNRGSDVASLETTARKDGDDWVINGAKQWISDAAFGDFAIVFAQTDDGIRSFIIERGTEGMEMSFEAKKGSMRAGDVGSLALTDCRVPEANRLPEAKGLKPPLSCLNQARFAIAWGAMGASADCYETALNYTKEREQFGVPIASFQLVQEKLVDMLNEITKGQLLAYRLGRMLDEGKANYVHISLAKRNNMRTARMCAAKARELLGGNGVSLEYSPIRHMANAESVYTYQGTDDIHTLILGHNITGIPAYRTKV